MIGMIVVVHAGQRIPGDPDGQQAALPDDETPTAHHGGEAVAKSLAKGHSGVFDLIDVFADGLPDEFVRAVQPAAENGEHINGGMRVLQQECSEFTAIERQRFDGTDGANAGRAGFAGEHGEFAEKPTGTGFVEQEFAATGILGKELYIAFDNDVEIVAGFTFAEDDLAGGEVVLVHDLADAVDLLVIHRAEEGDLL